MGAWLSEDVQEFADAVQLDASTRVSTRSKEHSILLRAVRVLDNKRLFGSADVNVFAVVIDGFPDMTTKQPFWLQELRFSNVKDGALLSIDPDVGWLIYRGRPGAFLNIFLLVTRDKKGVRDFATLLKENMAAEGIATVAGAAISVFVGAPGAAPAVRELAAKAAGITLDYYKNQKDAVIGVHYASLIKELDYGKGFRPPDYPQSMIRCEQALEIGYQVLPS